MEGGGAGTAVALVTHTALWTECCDLTSAETLHAEAGCAFILTPPGHKSSADQIFPWVECSGLWGWGEGRHPTSPPPRTAAGIEFPGIPGPSTHWAPSNQKLEIGPLEFSCVPAPFQHLPCSIFLEYVFLSFIEHF